MKKYSHENDLIWLIKAFTMNCFFFFLLNHQFAIDALKRSYENSITVPATIIQLLHKQRLFCNRLFVNGHKSNPRSKIIKIAIYGNKNGASI